MERASLGGSGIAVSRVILGCGIIGGLGSARSTWGRYGQTEPEARAVLDRALSLGITCVDTANSYAGGASEEVLGRWIADRHPGVLVATKVGNVVEPGQQAIDLTRAHILRQLPRSLDRLGLDHVDVYLSHGPDTTTPIAETLEAFAALMEQGVVRSFGACNVDAHGLRAALDTAERLGVPRHACVQNEYSLLAHGDDREVIPLCVERNVAYIAHSPLAGGVLSGTHTHGAAPAPDSRMAVLSERYAEYLTPDGLAGAARVAGEAHRRNVSPSGLALAWVLSRPGVGAVVAGPRRVEHLDAVAEAMSIALDLEEQDRLAVLARPGVDPGSAGR